MAGGMAGAPGKAVLMKKMRWVSCGILKEELSKVIADLGIEVEVLFLSSRLHADFNKLEKGVMGALRKYPEGEVSALIYGCQCHPDMAKWGEQYHLRQPREANCLGMLLGEDRRRELSQEKKTIFLTRGWLDFWDDGMLFGGNAVRLRGMMRDFDRILALDTGFGKLDMEKVQMFADYTQLPVEVFHVGLANLEKVVRELAAPGS